MIFFRRSIVTLLIIVSFSVTLSSQIISETDPRPIEIVFHKVAGNYWDAQALRFNPDVDSKFLDKAIDEYKESVEKISERIINGFGKSAEDINVFKTLVNECSEINRSAFFPVVDRINQFIRLKKLDGEEFEEILAFDNREKTEYIYRLGRELRRELIKAEWVIFRKTIMKNVKVSMVVEADVAKFLKVLYPVLFLIDLGSWLINGEAYFCYKTTFTTQHKLFFRTKAKIGQNKVYFEVLRAKKNWWGSPDWETYGETYKLIEEPTGEELANEMKVLD